MNGKWALLDLDSNTLSSLLPFELSVKQPKMPSFAGLFDLLLYGSGKKKALSELELSKAFITIVNKAKKIFSWHTLVRVDAKSDLDDPSRNKVDVGVYWWNQAPKGGRPQWSHQRMWIEFKKDEYDDDPFDDDNLACFEAKAETRRKNRGQLIAYAEMTMQRQQRTHLYSVFVLGRCARILRWDRAGACVTKKFDYAKHPEILGEFFWRFSHSTLEAQGHDPSAVLVRSGTKEYRLMDKVAREGDKNHDAPFDYIRALFYASLETGWPRYKLEVEDETKGKRYFLVAKPQFTAPGLAGRGTRSYVAFDIEDRVFVHLKDQWRYDFPDVVREGDILEKLNRAGVRNVPTLVCHGDVRDQCTETQDRWMALPESFRNAIPQTSGYEKERYPPKRLVHYRLVEKEVGKSLKEFETSYHLVRHIADGVIAHQDAVIKAGILHRDVSAGNLLIYPTVKRNADGMITKVVLCGLLNDWELSKPVVTPGTAEESRHSDRTGTWQFMSVHILNDRYRPPSIEDELESFFHVLLYHAIRYLHHDIADVGDFMNTFFDNYTYVKGEYKSGRFKEVTMETGHISIRFGDDPEQDHPLNDLICDLLSWFASYYRVVKHDRPPPPPPLPKCSPSSASGSFPGPSPTSSSRNAIGSDDRDEISKEEQSRLVNFVRTAGRGRSTGLVAKDREKAAYLSTHHAMYEFLRGSLLGGSWPPDDKASKDQLPPDYSPTGKEDGIITKYTQKNNTAIGQASALGWGDKGSKRTSDALADGLTSSNKRQKTSPLSGPPLHC